MPIDSAPGAIYEDSAQPTRWPSPTSSSRFSGTSSIQGSIDCSANPNYPAASQGDAYAVSVAGNIGGASGAPVDVGDMIIALADNAGGDQARRAGRQCEADYEALTVRSASP